MTENEARKLFVDTAKSYLGYSEASGKHRQIIDIYNAKTPLPRNYKVTYTDAWCATFVSAMAIKCGMATIIPRECSCYYQVEQFRKMERWQENDNYIPKPGDIIYYDWQDSGKGDNTGVPDHVGIVEKVAEGSICVIEGNYHDNVDRRYITVGARYIRGYGLPNFAWWAKTHTAPAKKEPKKEEKLKMPVIQKGSRGYHVKVAQSLLALNGYKCGSYGADGDFGGATEAATRAYQKAHGLTVDGIIGEKTWAAMLGI